MDRPFTRHAHLGERAFRQVPAPKKYVSEPHEWTSLATQPARCLQRAACAGVESP
jgi:hypothetical protein